MIDQAWSWLWMMAHDQQAQGIATGLLVGAFMLAVILNKS